jgi:type IV pilus assembly protein PilF
MKTSERLLLACVLSLLMAGCVQTTTTVGGVRPDADENDAAELNYQLGARYYRNGSYELARDRLLTSIELNPRNAVAHYTLALTYEALGNLRLATESYDESVRIAPRNHQVQNAYAVFLCKQRNYEDARRHFDRAAEIKTNDDPEITLTNAGVCMMQQPDRAAAESYFRQALEHKSNYGEALIQMAVLKHATGEDLNARAFLQRYLAANPAAADVLYLGVEIEEALGDERARTEYAEQILRDFPTSPQARLILDDE